MEPLVPPVYPPPCPAGIPFEQGGVMGQETSPAPTRADIDQILGWQLLIAWAGEADTEPPRQGWWRTAMLDEFGGADLLARLTPRTWQWGVLQVARTAAMRTDASLRARFADPEAVRTLFHLGFALDEPIADRIAELARARVTPADALPILQHTTDPRAGDWNAASFADLLGTLGRPRVTDTPQGRRLDAPASTPLSAARALAAAHAPLAASYPLPHFLVKS